MTYRLSISTKTRLSFCIAYCLCAIGCQSLPEGFQPLDDVSAKKLISFGAGENKVAESQFVLLQWQVMEPYPDSAAIVHEAMVEVNALSSVILNELICKDVLGLAAGAMVEYIAPSGAFAENGASGIARFQVTIENCFVDQRQAARFLATCAGEGMRSEDICLDHFTAIMPDLHWEAFNDLRLGFKKHTEGDSVKVDRNVIIEYRTFLLGGEGLDSLTTMEFPFGKSGQLLPAMQWGLAKMKEGEAALILTPSEWAFGNEGHPGSRIPPHTPVYWDVRVVSVD